MRGGIDRGFPTFSPQKVKGKYEGMNGSMKPKPSFSFLNLIMKVITLFLIFISVGVCYLSQKDTTDQQQCIHDIKSNFLQIKEISGRIWNSVRISSFSVANQVAAGKALLKNNDPVGAESMCNLAIEQSPTDLEAWICLGESRLALHNIAWSSGLMENQICPDFDKLESARRTFETAVNLKHGAMTPSLRLGLGLSLFLTASRDSGCGIKLKGESISQLLFDAILHFNAAVSLSKSPTSMPLRKGESSQHERELIQLVATYNMGLAHLALGDSSSATSIFRKISASIDVGHLEGINISELNYMATLVQRGSTKESISIYNDKGVPGICTHLNSYDYASSKGERRASKVCAIAHNNFAVAMEANWNNDECSSPYEAANDFERKLRVQNGFVSRNNRRLQETDKGHLALEEAVMDYQNQCHTWNSISRAEVHLEDSYGSVEAGIIALKMAVHQVKSASGILDKALQKHQDSPSVATPNSFEMTPHLLREELFKLQFKLSQQNKIIQTKNTFEKQASNQNVNSINVADQNAESSEEKRLNGNNQLSGEVTEESKKSPERNKIRNTMEELEGNDTKNLGSAEVSAYKKNEPKIIDVRKGEEGYQKHQSTEETPTDVSKSSDLGDTFNRLESKKESNSTNTIEKNFDDSASMKIDGIANISNGQDYTIDNVIVIVPGQEWELVTDTDDVKTNATKIGVPQISATIANGEEGSDAIALDKLVSIDKSEFSNGYDNDRPRRGQKDENNEDNFDIFDEIQYREEIKLPELYNPAPIQGQPDAIPSIAMSYMKMADAYLQKKNYKLASKQFLKVLKKAPWHIPARLGFASSLERSSTPKQLGEVILAYTNVTKYALIQKNEALAVASFKRALSLASDIKVGKLNVLEKLSTIAFSNEIAAEVQYELGMESLNNYEAAIFFKTANKYMANNSDSVKGFHAKSLVQLGRRALEFEGNATKSLALLESALRVNLGDLTGEALVISARSKQKLGNNEGAIEDYKKAIIFDNTPSDSTSTAHFNLAILMMNKNMDSEEIKGHVEMALNLGLDLNVSSNKELLAFISYAIANMFVQFL